MTQTQTTVVTCNCPICGGKQASVPAALVALTKTKQGRHGVVHIAHDPNAITGAAARARTGITAVSA